ncbi:LxmA leader domain family RiPP [Streptomyces sp. AJS327]|uniref:LxmA leader domain family RiPP n=1 Tax=Streptomyces sp. AJS327 TaxID=2545265 RepID=UPI0015DF4039|nr:LxmA leader domain family RiPP [Streptomyces sp. AJS327]
MNSTDQLLAGYAAYTSADEFGASAEAPAGDVNITLLPVSVPQPTTIASKCWGC